MVKKTVFNCDYPMLTLPIIEVNKESTAGGDILLRESIKEIASLSAKLYLVIPPDLQNENWQISGSDIYSTQILSLTHRKNDTGKIIINYNFSPSNIQTLQNIDYYGTLIKINEDAAIEIIFKIKNYIF